MNLIKGLVRIIVAIVLTIMLVGVSTTDCNAGPPRKNSTHIIKKNHKGMGNRYWARKKKSVHGRTWLFVAGAGTLNTCKTYPDRCWMRPMSYKRYYYWRHGR
jgi:hypothetical protein